MEPDIKVVAQRVEHVRIDLADFKRQQETKWAENRQTHADLYSKLDRLPAWATIAIALLSATASGAIIAAIKG